MVVPGGAWPALAPAWPDRSRHAHGADPFEWSGLGAWSISVKSCRTEASVDSGLRGKGYVLRALEYAVHCARTVGEEHFSTTYSCSTRTPSGQLVCTDKLLEGPRPEPCSPSRPDT